jgi:hypothetical protein
MKGRKAPNKFGQKSAEDQKVLAHLGEERQAICSVATGKESSKRRLAIQKRISAGAGCSLYL